MQNLQLYLLLLASAVLVVVVFRTLKLPAIIGYLLVGVCIGPHGLGLVAEDDGTRELAEFGVVFLMFSVGLEFSLGRLMTMRRLVFGLGGSQVVATMALVSAAAWALGLDWRTGVVLGGVFAMSSTAIVTKLLEEKMELNSEHGRRIIGVLLFQDLAVVPLLIVIPALAEDSAGQLARSLMVAGIKAALVLGLLLFAGQRLMRAWFHLVARQKSSELFVLNVLLITLSLAYITSLAGLSLALGAFVAGMLISETEYRYQVEDDIKPFRDILLGLFFITIGMMLDFHALGADLGWVLLVVLVLVAVKTLLVAGLARLFGADTGVSLRTGLDLAQGGEFGFVLLSLAAGSSLLGPRVMQITLASIVVSMLLAPFIIEKSERMVRRFRGAEWLSRAMALTQIAARSMAVEQHVLICGYGRSGQNLARLLERESIAFIALDNDPERVREAAAAGEEVVFGDATRREVLMAAGVMRAKVLVVSVADTRLALHVLAQVRDIRPELPVIVRTLDDTDIDTLKDAGAAEVVAEIMEGSLMLASHALMLIGVPLNRVLKRIRLSREQRYGLFRGFFRGVTDTEDTDERGHARLHTVGVDPGAYAIGKTLAELDLARQQVEVKSIRRRNIRGIAPEPETVVEEGDLLVLLGAEENLAAAEIRLLQG